MCFRPPSIQAIASKSKKEVRPCLQEGLSLFASVAPLTIIISHCHETSKKACPCF